MSAITQYTLREEVKHPAINLNLSLRYCKGREELVSVILEALLPHRKILANDFPKLRCSINTSTEK
jgi:hypothetical protein